MDAGNVKYLLEKAFQRYITPSNAEGDVKANLSTAYGNVLNSLRHLSRLIVRPLLHQDACKVQIRRISTDLGTDFISVVNDASDQSECAQEEYMAAKQATAPEGASVSEDV